MTFLGNFICDESERPNASEGENGNSKVLLGLWLRVLVMREIQTSKEFRQMSFLLIYWHETGCHENFSPIWGDGEPNNDSKFRFHQNSLGGTGEFILRLTSRAMRVYG